MADQLENTNLKFSCSQNWDNMTGAKGGRHCDKCNKTVYDFTNSKTNEFRAIMAENNHNVCGRFTKEQVTAVIVPKWKKWVSAALLVVGFGFLTRESEAQTISINNDKNVTASQDEPQYIFGGVNEVMPEFPGGNEKLKAFLVKNIDQTRASKRCRVNLTFVIEKDGSLSNIKPMGKIEDQTSVIEAIRVIKLSPKWIAGKQNGKTVRVQYTIPIVFIP